MTGYCVGGPADGWRVNLPPEFYRLSGTCFRVPLIALGVAAGAVDLRARASQAPEFYDYVVHGLTGDLLLLTPQHVPVGEVLRDVLDRYSAAVRPGNRFTGILTPATASPRGIILRADDGRQSLNTQPQPCAGDQR